MLAPKSLKDVECVGQTEEKRSEAARVRRIFSSSGLYSALTSKLLWKVDWYADLVFVANSSSVVRIGPWPMDATEEAFSIIESGNILRSYTVGDITVSVDSLPKSASHFTWLREMRIDDSAGTIHLETLEDRRLVFELETGKMLDNITPVSDKEKGNSSKCNRVFSLVAMFFSYFWLKRY